MKLRYLIKKDELIGKIKEKISAGIKSAASDVMDAVKEKSINYFKEQAKNKMEQSKTKIIIRNILIILGVLVVLGAAAFVVYKFIIKKKDEFDEELDEVLSEDAETEETADNAEEAAADSEETQTEEPQSEVE